MLAIVRVPLLFVYFLLINIILILWCICRPFHKNNVHVGGRLYSSMASLLGLKIIVRGQEHVPDSPSVIIANHQNSLDLITVCRAVPKGCVSVGKRSLIWIPVFGLVYWLSGNIFIDRKNASRASDTIKSTVKKIKERKLSVWLFPEGTRSRGKGLLPFKMGAFRIAQTADEPVVTMCASNLHDKVQLNRWNNGILILQFSTAQKMDDSKSLKEWSNHFHDQMQNTFEQLNSEVAELEKAG
ncbi:MAG: 1-acylglycerol-3-phosphate O-acyltransferase [Aestuariibacter sp.]